MEEKTLPLGTWKARCGGLGKDQEKGRVNDRSRAEGDIKKGGDEKSY